MRLLIDIGHPAHVHFFRNTIKNLMTDGHEVRITARNKEVALELLNLYRLRYENIGENYQGLLKKAWGMLAIDYRLYRILKNLNTI